MKAIVVEGTSDYLILKGIFPQIRVKKVMLRQAHGISSAFAIMKTLIDYGYDVLAVFDTDTAPAKSDNDNRKIIERLIHPSELAGRSYSIVWMDSCIEDVLEKAVPGFSKGYKNDNMLEVKAAQNRQAIMTMPEFQTIEQFINA